MPSSQNNLWNGSWWPRLADHLKSVYTDLHQGRLLLTLAAPFFLLDLPSLASWAKNKSFEESQLEVANDLKEVQKVDAHISAF